MIAAVVEVVTSPPMVEWADSGAAVITELACPNCGSFTAKSQVLDVNVTPPGRKRQDFRLVRCPDCTCRFYQHPVITEYEGDEMISRGRAALYLQQGAGLATLFRPIARIARPSGCRFLDIGCGYGFGLDFARHAYGWDGQGIDPGQMAALGRTHLGVVIADRLFTEDEPNLKGAFDVVMSAETLEHVADPLGFLRSLQLALTDDGVLVLTTPDADIIQPSAPHGLLAGVLSPGLHVVLQSELSLCAVLQQMGFTALRVEREGASLVVYASRRPLQLNDDPQHFQTTYLDYLRTRAFGFDCNDDLFWGFAGRAFFEAVNAADYPRAHLLRPHLAVACHQRFGIDLDQPQLPDITSSCSLERMAQVMPLNFAVILYADAMLSVATQRPQRMQGRTLRLAAEAARRLARAVGDLAMADPLSEDLAWVADAEALLCAGRATRWWHRASLLPHALSLPPGPGGAGVERREAVLDRIQAHLLKSGCVCTAWRLYKARRVSASQQKGPKA